MQTRRWGNEQVLVTTEQPLRYFGPLIRLANGNVLSVSRETGSGDIFGQLLDPTGNPIGDEITLLVSNHQWFSGFDVAPLPDGGFYFVWTAELGEVNWLLGRVFSPAGAPVRDQPVLFSDGLDGGMTVAPLNGGAVAVWTAPGGVLTFRIFDAAGNGGDIRTIVDTGVTGGGGGTYDTVSGRTHWSLASSPDGMRFAHIFMRRTDTSFHLGVRDASGTQLRPPVLVYTEPSTVDITMGATLAWINNTDVVVAWTNWPARQSEMRIFTTRLSPDQLVPVTGVITVNGTTDGRQIMPQIAALPDGRFVVGWLSREPESFINSTIRVQAFDARGNRLGGEAIAATSAGGISEFRLRALADGRVAVSWSDVLPPESDMRLQITDPRGGTVLGSPAADTLYGHDLVHDEITGFAGNDTLHGLRGDDALWGGDGDDVLDGGRGADAMHGGRGNDLYLVDSPDDTVSELPRQGTDTIQSAAIAIDLALFTSVENATLTGALPLAASGNGFANTLNGASNSAANVLTGRGGNDTYILGAGDTAVEAPGGGSDTVQSAAFSLNLSGFPNVENIVLTGALPLSATGNAGANAIDGAQNSAANVLTGLAGDDTYTVGLGDTVVEAAGGGSDTVASAALSLNLAQFPQVETLALLGSLPLTATGNAGANTLDGAQNSAANILTGLGGNDIYVVGPGDTVVEAPGAGTDRVESALIGVDLAAHPNTEWLILRGALPLAGKGTGGADILDGSFNSAANVLTGLGGNDTYVVGAGDTVVEAPGGGTDRVQAWNIGLDLALYPNVENATLTGAQDRNLVGNAGPNLLTGNAGANIILGLGGGDTLVGLGGSDVIHGGPGADAFRFLAAADSAVGAGRDVIHGFNAAEGDRIDLAAIDANGALAGDPAFVFLGTAAFSGAAGQVRYDVAGPDVILQGSIAGGAATFEIRLAGIGALSAGDLLL